VGWSRRQPGTADLRALLYLDESAGLLPPHPANPPTKWPLLTLLKQARAVGLGVMVATQNPVDLDYKAMSNAGTWLVGRLRTAQDRRRVLDGLAQAGIEADPPASSTPARAADTPPPAAAPAPATPRGPTAAPSPAAAASPAPAAPSPTAATQRPADLDAVLASLPPRRFALLDDRGVRLVHSRHTRALLRGPLTRAEVTRLVRARPVVFGVDDGLLPHPPPLPAGLSPRWLHPDGAAALGHAPTDEPRWEPALYARLDVRFDTAREVVEERTVHRLLRVDAVAAGIDDLPEPTAVPLPDDLLHRQALPGGRYRPLPGWLGAPEGLSHLRRDWQRRAARDEQGPPEAWSTEADDVSLRGLVLVWIPT
jgi:hypothetical protein